MGKVNIGIIVEKYDWSGGVDFLVDLIKVFEYEKSRYNIYVFVPWENFIERLLRKIHRQPTFKQLTENAVKEIKLHCNKTKIVFYHRYLGRFNKDQCLLKKALKYDIRILMPFLYAPKFKSDRIITIGYVYDFQYKRLPDYFPLSERNEVDKQFKALLSVCDYCFVQSADTQRDVYHYFKEYYDKVIVLPDYPYKKELSTKAVSETLEKYNVLDKKYFLISNQFWKHKSHITAFLAFEDLYMRGYKNIELLCTGNTKDFRFPEYFDELLAQLNALKCKNNIKILGFIDKDEQLALLNGCVALIQPTLFEGNPGGCSVVEAMSYGVPFIVSDIPVNLEIDKQYEFKVFKRRDYIDLADKIEEYIKSPKCKKDNQIDYSLFYEDYNEKLTAILDKRK